MSEYDNDHLDSLGTRPKMRSRHYCGIAGIKTNGMESLIGVAAAGRSPLNSECSNMSRYDNDQLGSLRAALLNHPIYTHVASVADLRLFMEDHVFAVWDFMSLLKRLQQDMTCIRVPWFPADNAKAARLINDIVIGEETDIGPDGSYVSHLGLYLRAMAEIGASTRRFERFRALVSVGVPVEVALRLTGAPSHVQVFVAQTMALANSASTEEVLAGFFYGREDIIPEMFRRLLDALYGAKHNNDRLRHFIYYIDRHIELDGDSHGPKGRELLDDLVADSPQAHERVLRAACSSIQARIGLWDGTLSKLRDSRGAERSIEREPPDGRWRKATMAATIEHV
jgi:Protein of unknown function (DUF3050)